LDGTLLDSVDLHAIAWHEAMMKFRHDVNFEQARGQIGKGGDKLIPVFLSADEQRDHGKELEEWRAVIVSRPSICRLCVPSRRSPTSW
jgi:phosphoglycolate phosphatase-like HAD superfamily hydrolase